MTAWVYRLCRKSIVDRARCGLVSMPALVPAHLDHGASMAAFLAVHKAVIFACRHLPAEDPALPALRAADTAIWRWREAWGHRETQADIYARYDALVRSLENEVSDVMGWTRLSAPLAA
jgi:hypothetical protein